MKYLRCEACGKAQPAAAKCVYCGAQTGSAPVTDIPVHPNAAAALQDAEQAAAKGDFKRASELTAKLTAKLPDSASVFWIRTLAQNRCRNTGELIMHGISAQTDPDFANAEALSEGIEHDAIRQAADAAEAVQKKLTDALRRLQYQELRDADVYRLRDDAAKKTEACKEKLYACWEQLRKVESALCALDLNGELLIHSEREAIKSAGAGAIQEQRKINETANRIDSSDLQATSFRLSALLCRSEAANAQIRAMQHGHPWTASQKTLLNQRAEARSACEKAVADFQRLNAEIAEQAEKLTAADQKYRSAILNAEEMNFTAGAALLGADAFLDVLASAGITGGRIVRGKDGDDA